MLLLVPLIVVDAGVAPMFFCRIEKSAIFDDPPVGAKKSKMLVGFKRSIV